MTYQPLNRWESQNAARWGVRLLLGVLGLLVALLSVGFGRMAWREHEINAMIAHQTTLNEAQRTRNQELEAEAVYRESNTYAELAARDQLGMARPGETVLLPTMVTPPLAQPSPVAADLPVSPPANAVPQPNYQRWWHAFFPPNTPTP